ncbi:MAG: cupin protein [Citricoccus sp.]|nr:cupin protein [Citricoccus sp. WCRC_4]
MELRTAENSPRHRLPGANTPTVTVVFGGEAGGPDVGLVRVRVPAGGGMPAHRHGNSDVVVTPVSGQVTISDGESSVDVGVGSSALVLKDEEVSLTNSGKEAAELLVSAGPADFVAGVRRWPEYRGA